MNRKMMAVCSAALAAALLAGCMDTPGSVIVRAKDGYHPEEAQTAGTALQDEAMSGGWNGTIDCAQTAGTAWQDEAAGLRKLLGAPERYESDVTDATGNIQIHTAASVEVPDIGHVSAIPVKPHT